MRWGFLGILGAIGFLASGAEAGDVRLDEARQALTDGLPQVAVARIRSEGESWNSPEERLAAQALLGRALFAAGRSKESVEVLEALSSPPPDARYCLASAQATLQQHEKALVIYEGLAGDEEFSSRAAIGCARMLEQLDRCAEARERLDAFLKSQPAATDVALVLAALQIDAGDSQAARAALDHLPASGEKGSESANYLRARAHLLDGEATVAEALLRQIAVPPADLAPGVAVALADCQRAGGEESEKILEQFIENNPRLPGLNTVFAALERLSSSPQSSISEYRKWSKDDKAPDRAALAQYYRARAEHRSGRADKGMRLLEGFLTNYPRHPRTEDVLADLAAWKLADGKALKALAIAQKGEGARLRFVEGEALVALGRHEEAAVVFLKASEDPDLAIPSLTNAALCGMLAGVPDSENSALAALGTMEGGEAARERIVFLEAMHHASQRAPDAFDRLQDIAGSSSPWASRARLALAEWQNLQLDREGAQSEILKISTADPAESERIAYLGVFLSDTGDADAELQTVTLATDFLKQYPGSAFMAEVRMKLGEVLHRRGDYLASHREFSLIAKDFPDSPLADTALFMAAQAKSRSMSPNSKTDAIELYEQVAQGDSPLSLRARLSQALLFNALNRPKEALGVLENILTGTPDSELRSLALLEMGDTHFAQGEGNPKEYEEAIAAWEKLAGNPEVSKTMRHQALVKMGAANEKLGRSDAALASYHQVFSSKQEGEPEYFWFYKSGFDAGRLLESQENWKEAIVVYETIAAVEGPRAGEARDQVNKLRLENFIWDK